MSRVGREEYRSYLDSPNQSAVYWYDTELLPLGMTDQPGQFFPAFGAR